MKPSYKLSAILILSVLLLLATQFLYARAGGGGGGGGSGGGGGGYGGSGSSTAGVFAIISCLCLAIFAWYKKQRVTDKKQESEAIIAQAAQEDPIWDESRMEGLARDMFSQMQQAWMDRDLSDVKGLISDTLYNDYTTRLDLMKTNHEQNILEGIGIRRVTIISAEDYKDNSQDAFTAYVAGGITDYTINDQTGDVIKNQKQDPEDFSDLYEFIRQGDKWILNNIQNDVSLSDINNAVNYKEE